MKEGLFGFTWKAVKVTFYGATGAYIPTDVVHSPISGLLIALPLFFAQLCLMFVMYSGGDSESARALMSIVKNISGN